MQTATQTPAAQSPSNKELLSAWMDGDAFGDEDLDAGLMHRHRDTWDTYHLIGDVMRSRDLAITPSDAFQTRLSRALEAELPIVAAPRRRVPWRMGFSGFAVAAAVATVVWVAQPYFETGVRTGGGQVLADAGSQAPMDAGLRDYLEAHRQMAGPSAVRQVSFEAGMGR